MTSELWFDLMKESIPFITAVILFCLTSKKDNHVNKKAMLKERLEKCYFPFYRLYFTGLLSEIPFSKITTENREKFIDLLTDNIYLLDLNSQRLFGILYSDHVNLVIAIKKGDSELPYFEQTLNSTFYELKCSIFSEYRHLLKQLGLPVPRI